MLVAAAGCGGGNPRVVVVGDSLTAGAHDQIEDAVGRSVRVDGLPGATIRARLETVRDLATRDPEVVVIALGTNDGFFGTPDPGGDAALLLDLLDRVRCVRWIGVAGVKGKPALVNIPIAEAVDRHRNAVLLDWANVAREHPEWHEPDGVHHTPEGMEAFAAFIADAVRSCGSPRDS